MEIFDRLYFIAPMASKEDIEKKIAELEAKMQLEDFWADKVSAQAAVKELQALKAESEGGSRYEAGDAIMTIFSGAGGDDAEDFSAMLFRMYGKYFDKLGWSYRILHENQKDHRGYLNISI